MAPEPADQSLLTSHCPFGQTADGPTGFVDVFPTLCGALGLEPRALFIGTPDATVTRNRYRWRQGFGYGGQVSEERLIADETGTLGQGDIVGQAGVERVYDEILSAADRLVFGDPAPTRSRRQVLEAYGPFVERQLARGIRLQTISRHILGLFQGQPGARAWRRHLSEQAHRPGAGPEVLLRAAALVPDAPV